MGESTTTVRRRGLGRVTVAAIATAIALSSCSALSTPVDDGETAGPVSSDPTADATGDAGDTAGAGEDAVDEQGGASPESIWQRADDAIFLPDSPRSDFADLLAPPEAGGEWTVIGSIFEYAEARNTPTVWTTADPLGKDWTPTTIEHAGGSVDSKPNHAERFGSTIVAVGQHGRETELRPAVWLNDGADWAAVETEQFDGGREAWLYRVAAGTAEQGVYALGSRVEDTGRVLPELWHSDDGRTWELLDAPFADDEAHRANSIAISESGVVVVGSTTSASNIVGAAWFSPDGRSWERATVPDLGSDRTIMNGVTALGGRFVAVGGAADQGVERPVSWTSDDGITWSDGGGTFGIDDGDIRSSTGFGSAEVDNADGRLVAIGSAGTLQHIWTSDDGRTWRPLPGLLDFRSRGFSVAGFGGIDGEITIATDDPSIVHHADGWSDAAPTSLVMPSPDDAPFITDLVATDQGFTAVGGNNTTAPDGSPLSAAAAWHSTDGLTWTRIPELRRAERGSITSGVFDGTDVLAVGRERLGSDPASPSDGLLWRSVSEERWQPVVDASFTDEQRRIGFDTITRAGDTIIMGGFGFHPNDELGVEPIIVESDDGENYEQSTTPLGGPGNQIIDHLCGADDGRVVAIHELSVGNGATIGATVRDGTGRWTVATDTDGSFSATSSQGVDGCAHGADGFMAVGWVYNGTDTDVGLWASPDGSAWSSVEGPGFENDASEQWLAGVAAHDDGYVLIGRDGADLGRTTTVWVGRGEDWVAMPLPSEADWIRQITMAVNDGVVLVAGSKDGSRRVYRTTLEAIEAATDE